MNVTVCIPTFARTQCLPTAIASALRQVGAPPFEVLVVNDCTQQKLVIDSPLVRFLNLPERCASMAAKRQLCVERAAGTWIAWLDDDDLWMPWYLRTMCASIRSDSLAVIAKQWLRFSGHRWSYEDAPGGIAFMVRRDVALSFEAIASADPVPTGAENRFRAWLRREHAARLAWCATPGYGWCPASAPAPMSLSGTWDRTGDAATQRIATGQEPSGYVRIPVEVGIGRAAAASAAVRGSFPELAGL